MQRADGVPDCTMTEHIVFNQSFLVGRLPSAMARAAQAQFGECWDLHPAEFYKIRQPGTGVKIPVPRWQQAYGRDYRYSGNLNCALPVPPILEPFLAWSRESIEPRLNGLLLNWYDAAYGHPAIALMVCSKVHQLSPSRSGPPGCSASGRRRPRGLSTLRPHTASCLLCRGRATAI